MAHLHHHPAPSIVDDEGEAFARAVFCRFLRQATISRDIDDVIEHMHIVNDNSRTFDIRLGGEARVPVSRELILALAAKKKQLLALCESTLRTPRSVTSQNTAGAAAQATGGGGGGLGLSSSLQHYQQQGGGAPSNRRDPTLASASPPSTAPQAVVFPPPAALAAMQSAGGSGTLPIGRGGDAPATATATVAAAATAAGAGAGSGAAAATEVAAPAAVASPAAPAVVIAAEAGEDGGAGAGSDGGGGGMEEQQRAPPEQQPQQQSASPPPAAAASRSDTAASAFVPAATAAASWSRVPAARDPAGTTTLFVRKVDMRVDRDDFIKHFSRFGQVLSLSMNPTRGYAFVDLDSHAAVLRAVSAGNHTVGHRTLQVEVKKEPPASKRNRSSNSNGSLRQGGNR
eukprot:g11650.t1